MGRWLTWPEGDPFWLPAGRKVTCYKFLAEAGGLPLTPADPFLASSPPMIFPWLLTIFTVLPRFHFLFFILLCIIFSFMIRNNIGM